MREGIAVGTKNLFFRRCECVEPTLGIMRCWSLCFFPFCNWALWALIMVLQTIWKGWHIGQYGSFQLICNIWVFEVLRGQRLLRSNSYYCGQLEYPWLAISWPGKLHDILHFNFFSMPIQTELVGNPGKFFPWSHGWSRNRCIVFVKN